MTEPGPGPDLLPDWTGDVRRAYRDSVSDEMPGPDLDAAILAASRRAVGARPESADRQRLRRWGPPFAAAAVILIASSLLLLLHDERRHEVVLQDGPPATSAPGPAPVPEATRAETSGPREPAPPSRAVSPMSPSSSPAATPERVPLRPGRTLAPDVGTSAPAPEAALPAPAVVQVAPSAADADGAPVPSAPVAADVERRREELAPVATAPGAAAKARAAAVPDATVSSLRSGGAEDADALAAIRDLWETGRGDEARDRLNALRCRRPGILLPPDFPVPHARVPSCPEGRPDGPDPADEPARR
jgi:hypothetical protein